MKFESFKIIIDENLSRKLLGIIRRFFPGSSHVAIENLLNCSDTEIWDFAKSNSYTILTKDRDYNFMSAVFGCPSKVIRVSCGNKSTSFISEILLNNLDAINEFLQDEDLCYFEIE